MRRILLGLVLGAAAACALPATSSALDVDVTAAPYSAAGDGVTNDRVAIQSAIDAVNAAGGGTVTLPGTRTYLSGNVRLKSNVELKIARGATFKQSQTISHYDYTPYRDMQIPGDIPWNNTFYYNTPLIYGGNVSNVKVGGAGTIEMTHLPSLADTILMDAIGIYQVTRFEFSGLHLKGGGVPYVGIYFSNNGSMHDMTLNEPYKATVGGIELISSQDVAIERNVMQNTDGSPGVTDDGIAIGSIHNDPRSGNWWRSTVSEPTKNILIRDNVINVDCCGGIAFIPWASATADARDGEVRDITIENNTLITPSGWEPVKCWCDNPWNGPGGAAYSQAESDQSQMTNIRFANNVYSGSTAWFLKTRISSVFGAPFHPGNPSLRNTGFEYTGASSWVTAGRAGQAGAYDAPVGQSGTWYGYIQNFADGYTALYQGAGLEARTSYRVRARIQTSGATVRLIAHNQCTGETVGAIYVSPTSWTTYDLPFTTTSACSEYRIGIDSGSATSGWARIDDVELNGPQIDDGDPARVTYSGPWHQFADAGDFFGTHMTAWDPSQSVEVRFFGTAATWRSMAGPNMGLANVWLDGVSRGAIDFYRSSFSTTGVWSTGTLTRGWHTIRVQAQGAHSASSSGNYISLDSVAVSGW